MASALMGAASKDQTVCENKDAFKQWLSEQLQHYNADDEVFLPYILSILEEAESGTQQNDTEVLDSLADILEGLGLDDGSNPSGRIPIIKLAQFHF